TVKKPSYILVANLAVFFIITLGCYYLIPKYGVFGPPYVIAIAFFISFLIMTVLSIKEYRKIATFPNLKE
ncbi:MAG: hypothetical protein Q7U68_02815, partial [Candidatus Roizmanbacteria bacterium]|nr:hypothetical protein [Candidatus Roizmanbacteria bacterium]